jgi:hypothetical protein
MIKAEQEFIDSNLDEWIAALQTQYQIRSDAIVARRCEDAPTPFQLAAIREAHCHLGRALQYIRTLKARISTD